MSKAFPAFNEMIIWVFFFNDTATTEIYTLSLHDALPILARTSKTMLNKSGESGHPCLVPDLSGNAFSFSLLSMMFPVEIGRAHV